MGAMNLAQDKSLVCQYCGIDEHCESADAECMQVQYLNWWFPTALEPKPKLDKFNSGVVTSHEDWYRAWCHCGWKSHKTRDKNRAYTKLNLHKDMYGC